MDLGKKFFRTCNQDWSCRHELYESLVNQLLADFSPEQLYQFTLQFIIHDSTMLLHPQQLTVFSDTVIFTKFMYVKWHLILISIYLTANVVEYLFSNLITSDFFFM